MEKNSYTSALIHGTLTESIPLTGSTTFSIKRSYVPPTSECIEAESMVVLAGSTTKQSTDHGTLTESGSGTAKSTSFENIAEDDLTSNSTW